MKFWHYLFLILIISCKDNSPYNTGKEINNSDVKKTTIIWSKGYSENEYAKRNKKIGLWLRYISNDSINTWINFSGKVFVDSISDFLIKNKLDEFNGFVYVENYISEGNLFYSGYYYFIPGLNRIESKKEHLYYSENRVIRSVRFYWDSVFILDFNEEGDTISKEVMPLSNFLGY